MSEPQVFDNSSILDAYPGVVAPLSFSFARMAYAREFEMFARLAGVGRARRQATQKQRSNLLVRVDGRVYYDVGAWYCMLAAVPGFARNRAAAERIMGLSEPLDPALVARLWPRPKVGLAALADRARAGMTALRLLWNTIILRRTVLGFRRRVDALLALDERSIAALSLRDLAAEFARLESQLIDRWDAPLINDFVCAIAFGMTRSLFRKWFGADGLALHADFLLGQGSYVTSELPQRIRAMAELVTPDPEARAALRNGNMSALRHNSALYQLMARTLSRYGEYCGSVLKFEDLPLIQDRGRLFAGVLAAADMPPPPTAQVDDPLRRLAGLAASNPLLHLVARRLLRFASARVRDRDNLRFERTAVFGFARRLFLAMGQRLRERGAIEDARDVLLLNVEELLAVARGRAPEFELRGLVATRQQNFLHDQALPDPPERLMRGVSPELAAPIRGVPTREHTMLRGLGCAPGRVIGPVTVIRNIERDSLPLGAILVTRHFDPGWIALYPGAAAIVVELGGRLSPAGIVARAMGIPCVAGLRGATSWLADGDRVEVDGGSGRVTRVGA